MTIESQNESRVIVQATTGADHEHREYLSVGAADARYDEAAICRNGSHPQYPAGAARPEPPRRTHAVANRPPALRLGATLSRGHHWLMPCGLFVEERECSCTSKRLRRPTAGPRRPARRRA